MKKAAVNALLFGGIVCAVCTALTGSFLVSFVWSPFGLLFGILYFLFELVYMRIYKSALQSAEPEEHRIYINKIKVNSIISLGLLFQSGFFIFGICSVCCEDNYAWSFFVYSAIFALIAYALYIGSAVTEFIIFKQKRYIFKTVIIFIIGCVGAVTFGYGFTESAIWIILSCFAFIFEIISLFPTK